MRQTIEKAQKMEAEARAIRRAEKNFWKAIDARAEEVMEYLEKKIDLTYGKESHEEIPSESTAPYDVWS